ncbi:tRNA pseudouridine(55) synthase TruB [Tepidibacter formicigenes]|jgi:tRNA pseudouridine55 synthase|uniref:tRNA pseudouridine synthase B n=1 Tax=Tepidibacter formicigenes DSM 15518 TaxID=1123349 RepID=A0A1M6JD08_9FIRM|nr:tRNA pseudouridine(55) synthase TruB [Tepidibacter formicigenes]SHJ44510.1 tRNA pseudouridine55 synthase [Tepidibacter formicigenes DSM 15518]
MNGILNILKPTGMTSHDVVSKIRKITKIKKVGHTGTLDPNAAGVLPICIGKATKISEMILNKEKTYIGELTLGIQTDTYDSFGRIIDKKDVIHINEKEVYEAFEKFKGEINQTPPIYSAIKIKGKKLYELARAGQTDVNIKPRNVFIKSIEIKNISENKILFEVTCSKGTYIRSLCKDIGDELGVGGHMSFLLRTSSGSFDIKNSVTLEEFEEASNNGNLEKYLFNIDYPLENYKSINIKESAYKAFSNGNVVYKKGLITLNNYENEELVKVYMKDKFCGIGKIIFIDERISLKSYKLFL